MWSFLTLMLALAGFALGSYSLTVDRLCLSLCGQKLSGCTFIHFAHVLFPLCLSQPKHVINGRHHPKILSVLASLPQAPLPLP